MGEKLSTVLQIDDSRPIGDAVEKSLSSRRVSLVRCFSLCESLDYLRSVDRLPDAILMDLSLPDSRGMATLVAIVHEASGTPIVVFTDGVDEDTDTIRRGTTGYFVKGEVDLDDLSELMVNVADGRAQPVEEKTVSQVVEMVERVRNVMEG